MEKKVDFGFDNVAQTEKTQKVENLFQRVSGHYDLMNDLMSLGLHHIWKDILVAQLPKNSWLLDVAGGTGDIAIRYLLANKNAVTNNSVKINNANDHYSKATLVDLTSGMVARAKQNAEAKGIFHHLEFLVANAESLPMPANSFDIATIAFGLRNVTDRLKALKEIRRVLKPEGQFFCLEFSKVILPLWDKVAKLYNFSVLPFLGKWIVKDESAYRYLAESIERFPNQQQLVELMAAAGFKEISYDNLTGGIVAIHRGKK